MARIIDFESKLSAEDREYLYQKNRHDLIAENDRRFGDDNGEASEAPQRPESVHSPATTPVLTQQDAPIDTGPVDEPYSEWTVDELKEELKDRELPVSGTKPELIARLEEHDAADEGDDTTD